MSLLFIVRASMKKRIKFESAFVSGWMTLQGSKTDGTDMHSKTAASVGVSR